MGDLHNNKIQILFHLVDSDQVHESLVVPAGVDAFRWEDWFVCVNEHLQPTLDQSPSLKEEYTQNYLKHLLVVEKVVKIPLSDCPGIVVLQKEHKDKL